MHTLPKLAFAFGSQLASLDLSGSWVSGQGHAAEGPQGARANSDCRSLNWFNSHCSDTFLPVESNTSCFTVVLSVRSSKTSRRP